MFWFKTYTQGCLTNSLQRMKVSALGGVEID